MNITQYTTACGAIRSVTGPADALGVTICIDAGITALANGDQDVASAMLDEAAARAGMISDEKLRVLHRARLAGSRS